MAQQHIGNSLLFCKVTPSVFYVVESDLRSSTTYKECTSVHGNSGY
jgi:hypothetical protein